MARTVQVELVGDERKLKTAFARAGKDADHFGKRLGSGAGRGLVGVGKAGVVAAGILGGALVAGAGASVKAFMESEKVSAQTSAVLKSTGGAAGVTAKQVDDLATSIAYKSGVDDEAIASGENLLLTFTNIKNSAGEGNDIFSQTTQIMTDMAVAMGKDPQTQAIALGKALNDPIKGVTALTKVGVSFTQGQKDSIKAMVESGNVAGAQKIILQELQKEFGGSAEAAGGTFAGKLAILKVRLGNVAEEIGARLVPVMITMMDWISAHWPQISAIAQTVTTAVITAFSAVSSWIQTNWPQIKTTLLAVWEAYVSYWNGVVQPVFRALVTAFTAVVDWVQANWPTIKAVVTTVAEGVVTAFNFIRDTAVEVWPVIQAAAQSVIEWYTANIAPTIRAIATFWNENHVAIKRVASEVWNAISALVKANFEIIKTTITTILGNIKSTIAIALALIRGDWGAAWDEVKAILSRTFNSFKDIIGTALGLAKTAITTAVPLMATAALELGSKAADKILEGVKSLAGDLKDKVEGAIQGLAKAAVGGARTLGGNILEAVMDGASGLAGRLATWAHDAVTGAVNGLLGTIDSLAIPRMHLGGTIPGFSASIAGHGFDVGPWTVGTDIGPYDLTPSGLPRLAEGGVVKASTGGTMLIAGEAGRDEAIVPLPDNGGFLGGNTINVYASPGLDEFAIATLVDWRLEEARLR